jgi:hypothetical protein
LKRLGDVRALASVAVALVLAGATAGCGAVTDAAPEPPLGPIPRITEVAQIHLPIDDYGQSSDQFDIFNKAAGLLADACLRRAGFEPPGSSPAPQEESRYVRLFGVMELGTARARGYLPAPQLPTSDDVGGAPAPGSLGRVVSDCQGEVRSTLSQGVTTRGDSDLWQGSAGQAEDLARADSRTALADKDWSACMRERGYDYGSPLAPVQNRTFYGEDPASPTQVATAVADVECKTSTNYIGRAVAVQAAYQARLIDKNAEALQQAKEGHDAQLANALRIIAELGHA